MASDPSLSLPEDWPEQVKSGLLHAIALARTGLTDLWAGFENGLLVQARAAAKADRLATRLAQRSEELRILRARLERVPPRRRPHYEPEERFAILQLRAAAGWSATETARRFHVTANTIAAWMARLDEEGPNALLRTRTPVNRFPDAIAELLIALKRTLPSFGKVRVADLLVRAGTVLSATTVKRLLERKIAKQTPPDPAPESSGETDPAAEIESETEVSATSSKPPRTVTARYPHHLWHLDLTIVPTAFGFWVPWIPLTVFQRWPFCFWVGVVLDHFSRSTVASASFETNPSAEQVCTLLDAAVAKAGKAPRHLVTDQGSQFQSDYRAWCERHSVKPRYGAIGQHGSIAIIERFFRSLKDECFRRILVPLAPAAFDEELAAYLHWYDTARPHQSLHGATPAEILAGCSRASTDRRIEIRERYPLPKTGPPARRLEGELKLVVSYQGGRKHLPVVELFDDRKAA